MKRPSMEQIAALAPDRRTADRGRKLGRPGPWSDLGQSEEALWGRCRGSRLYDVQVDRPRLVGRCTCPSRKFPCKHVLGLLFLFVTFPDALPTGVPPDEVTDWLTSRREKAAKKKTVSDPKGSGKSAEARRRADRRMKRVQEGLDELRRWLVDRLRGGLARAEEEGARKLWNRQASRLVDAQAPGLAGRLRRLALVPGTAPDWPERLLDELGRMALLIEAGKKQEQLPNGLREEVRTRIGWSVRKKRVRRHNDRTTDRWLVLGIRIDDTQRIAVRRTWLRGLRTGRMGLLLDFAVGRRPFPPGRPTGSLLEGTLAFYPGAWPQRALIDEEVALKAVHPAVPLGWQTGRELREEWADGLAACPWLERIAGLLERAVPTVGNDGSWTLVDGRGREIPLATGRHWRLLAVSGGRPVPVAGEWDGRRFLPLSVLDGGRFLPLRGGVET